MNMDLDTLIRCWALSSEHHELPSGATEEQIGAVESQLGMRFPVTLRELYKFSDGPSLLDGNLSIYPLQAPDGRLSLLTASRLLREWRWPIPNEVLMLAGSGGDELFGLWLPPTHNPLFPQPVVEVGEIFKPGCMSVAGTDLVPFLVWHTAYYLLLYEATPDALDALSVPESLRFSESDLGDEELAALQHWADPGLPEPGAGPYQCHYDAQALRAIFSAA